MPHDNITVSVYCLAYNHEKYIRSALDGFVMQKTNFKYEVIVHDDASTDATADIIREYQEKYPDIIKPIFQTENQYSKGIKIVKEYVMPKVRGRYIAVCEGDDFWTDENKLQKQVDFLENHPDYAACVHNTVRWNLKINKKRLMNKSEVDYDIDIREVIPSITYVYQTSSLMCRREIYEKRFAENAPEFFEKAKRCGDYPLAIFILTEGKMRFLADTMSVYRLFTENSWTDKTWGQRSKWIDYEKNIIDMLKSADEYTDFKYSDDINNNIRKREFHIASLSCDKKIFSDPKYSAELNGKSAYEKFKLWIMVYMPKTYDRLLRIYRKG